MLFISDRVPYPGVHGNIIFDGDENASLPLHWHHNTEIAYFLRGGFRARVGEEVLDVHAGDLILVNSGQLHWLGEKTVGEGKGVSLVADMDFWKGYMADLDSYEFDLALCPQKVEDLKGLMAELYDAAGAFARASEREDANEVALVALRMESIVCSIYYLLGRYFSHVRVEEFSTGINGWRSSLRDVVRYVDTHYTDPITLKEVASLHGYSAEYLTRRFKKELGVTFKAYVNSMRMEHARRLLDYSDKNILDVAVESGFPDTRAFTQQFVRFYNMTPKEYRLRNAKARDGAPAQ